MSARVQAGRDHDGSLYQRIDWIFALFVVLEFVAFPLFPGLPLLVAASSMTTRIRTSKWRSVVLWTLGSILTLIVVAPFVIGWFHPSFVENGPAVRLGTS